MKLKKLTAIILVLLLLSNAASAQMPSVWINVSSWAYNDVSAFINEGLLPDDMSSVSDYRESATRGQFAHLVFSVLEKAQAIDQYEEKNLFSDGDYASEALASLGIVSGTGDNTFSPNENVTREDAAVMLYRAATYASSQLFDFSGHYAQFEDNDSISDYAQDAVGKLRLTGIISGDDNGFFNPKSNITIEQAIVLVYKTYQELPYTSKTDGAELGASNEVVIKSFGNGYYETKLNSKLFITNGVTRLMEFDTDMYSAIDCSVNKNGKLVMARRYGRDTEVYSLDTHKLLYTIPYPVVRCTDSYIYVTAKDNSALFGVYSYDGNELLAPLYSMSMLGEKYPDAYDIDVYSSVNTESITGQTFDTLPGMVKGTYVGSWLGARIGASSGDDYYRVMDSEQYDYECFKKIGLTSVGKNCVAVLTNFNGQTIFNMTWLGMNSDAIEKMCSITSRAEKRWSDLDEMEQIENDESSYSDVYNLTLTKVSKRFGNDYGVHGYFTLTVNGEVRFENAEGYIGNMPCEGKGDSSNTELSVTFESGGETYMLAAYLSFDDASEESIQSAQKREYLLTKSPDTEEVYYSRVKKAVLSGKEYEAESLSAPEMLLSYNKKYGIAALDFGTGDNDSGLYIQMKSSDEAAFGDNSISGTFYVTKNNALQWNEKRIGIDDAFHGTVSGIESGDTLTIKSDDGSCIIELEKAENPHSALKIRGTRSADEFITDDEPYFIGTPQEQDLFDLEEHNEIYRRIVVDDNGMVLYVVPVSCQTLPTSTTDDVQSASAWKNIIYGNIDKNDLYKRTDWILNDRYTSAYIPLENQFWEMGE